MLFCNLGKIKENKSINNPGNVKKKSGVHFSYYFLFFCQTHWIGMTKMLFSLPSLFLCPVFSKTKLDQKKQQITPIAAYVHKPETAWNGLTNLLKFSPMTQCLMFALALYGAGFWNKLDFSETHGQTHMLVFCALGHGRITQIAHTHLTNVGRMHTDYIKMSSHAACLLIMKMLAQIRVTVNECF